MISRMPLTACFRFGHAGPYDMRSLSMYGDLWKRRRWNGFTSKKTAMGNQPVELQIEAIAFEAQRRRRKCVRTLRRTARDAYHFVPDAVLEEDDTIVERWG